jgi:hypothetical protein
MEIVIRFIVACRRGCRGNHCKKLDGAVEEPKEPDTEEASAAATCLPGVGAGTGEGVGRGAGAGLPPARRQIISLRFNSASMGHWVGT